METKGERMEAQMKSMVFGLVLIIFGVSLVPVVFTALEGANWTLTLGGTEHNLSWVALIVGITFAVSLVGVGIGVLVKSFKSK